MSRGSYWKRADSRSRIRFAAVAILGWAIIDVIGIAAEVRHPHGGQTVIFLVISPLYFAFFAEQIRRARREERG